MLVLTRKENEKLLIGENQEIEVVIVEIRGDRVRIGVNAPKEIPVLRNELAEKIAAEQAGVTA